MDDTKIEAEIQAKGLTAPRVTPQDIEDNIISQYFFTAMEGWEGANGGAAGLAQKVSAGMHPPHAHLNLLTFCVLVLRNGFTVTGESACASPENFDAELGRKIARQAAVDKVWPLMGYALKDELHRRAQFDAEPKVGEPISILADGRTFKFPLPPADGAAVSLHVDMTDEMLAVMGLSAPTPDITTTFDEFVQYGRDNGGNIVNGMPWSFNWNGHPVTHENDQRYLVMIPGQVESLNFTPGDLLVKSADGIKVVAGGALTTVPSLLAAHSLEDVRGYLDRLRTINDSNPRIAVGDIGNLIMLDLEMVDAELTLRGDDYGKPRYHVQATKLQPRTKSA